MCNLCSLQQTLSHNQWITLIGNHHSDLAGHARAIGISDVDSVIGDLVGDAVRLENRFDPERGLPFPYLQMWFKNICLRHKRMSRRELPFPDHFDPEAAPNRDEDNENTGDNKAIEALEHFRQGLNAQQTIIFDGMLLERPHDEVADALGVSVGYSRVLRSKLKRAITKYLGPLFGEDLRGADGEHGEEDSDEDQETNGDESNNAP